MALSWITSLVVFVAVTALMVFSISRLKIHPFLSILGCALLLALLMGIPLRSIADVLGKGFSNIFARHNKELGYPSMAFGLCFSNNE